jgi:hypothetical protein
MAVTSLLSPPLNIGAVEIETRYFSAWQATGAPGEGYVTAFNSQVSHGVLLVTWA